MSDFLNNFSKDNYSKGSKVDEKIETKGSYEGVVTRDTTTVGENDSPEETREKKNVSAEETPSELDNESQLTKARARSLEEFKREDANESGMEETEIDPSFKEKRKKKILIIASSVLVSILLVGTISYFMLTVAIPDFETKEIVEFQKWAKPNSIKLEIEEIYSKEFESGIVISQGTKKGLRVRKGSVQKLTLSKGADPDEVVPLPELEKMNEDAIQKWINENKMRNIKIVQEYSTSLEKKTFIRYEFRDKEVKPESLKRKDVVTIFVSMGAEVFNKDIKLPSFKGKTKAEVDAWVKEKKIVAEYVFEEGYHETIEPGQIISQSVDPDTMIAKDTPITFVISKGNALYVPDLSSYSMADLKENPPKDIPVIVKEWYSGYAYGTFLEQSLSPGTNLSETDEKVVKVYFSVGRPYMDNLLQKQEKELAEYFYSFKELGANITYSVSYANPYEPRGSIIGASKYNQFVGMQDHVYITVSSGN